MKKFSELKIRKINEDSNLPDNNYEEMSKDDLVKMLQGQKDAENKPKEAQSEEETSDEKKPEILGEGSNPSKFFSKLFESREMAHIYHLQVNGEMGSHAKHTALGDYYEGVLGFVDDLIEICPRERRCGVLGINRNSGVRIFARRSCADRHAPHL